MVTPAFARNSPFSPRILKYQPVYSLAAHVLKNFRAGISGAASNYLE
jgi:hypothetical protein